MKEFPLSTPNERTASISFSAVMIVCFGILLYALRGNLTMLILCGLCVLLVTALLVYYVLNVLKAVCVVDPEKKTVEVRGVSNYTADVSGAVLLQTMATRRGQTSVRTLVFSYDDLRVIATVPTMFTYKQGILAEPMAKEMAAVLGIEFKQNVPEWEYDKEKFKEHQKEEAEAEKAAAKERRQKRMEYRIQKLKNKNK